MPDNYGILLNSDVPSMERHLAEIRQSLAQLKQFRLSGPTSEYFHSTRRPQSVFSNNRILSDQQQMAGISAGEFGKSFPPPSMVQIRSRLLNMEWHIEGRVRELLDEYRNRRANSHTVPTRRQLSAPPSASLFNRAHFVQEQSTNYPIYDDVAPLGQHRQLQPNLALFDEHSQRMAQNEFASATTDRPTVVQQNVRIPSPPLPTVTVDQNALSHGSAVGTGVGGRAVAFEPIRPLILGSVTAGRDEARTEIAALDSQQYQKQQQSTVAKSEEKPRDTVHERNENEAKAEEKRRNADEELERRNQDEKAEPMKQQQQKQEDENFRKMLEVLKNPRKFNISSTESSSSESPRREQKPVPSQQPLTTVTPAPAPPPTGPTVPAVTVPQMYTTNRDSSDSDSDFFK
ncbi:hypothetical protein niasHT_024029 [Heterodera trifolii]|uniref:Uncharacterized protein n=1 Tax=Heterodera trifolii TaxID=157864 RepID=A0ABD2KQF5_9BILA